MHWWLPRKRCFGGNTIDYGGSREVSIGIGQNGMRVYIHMALIAFLSAGIISCGQQIGKDSVDRYPGTGEARSAIGHIEDRNHSEPIPVHLEIERVAEADFYEACQQAGARLPVEKVVDHELVSEKLKGVVEFRKMEGYLGVEGIRFRNGTSTAGRYLLDECSFVAYFPKDDVLLLEGGHSTDVSFDLETGLETHDVGNPDLAATSPNGLYRLTKIYEGQECFYHFIQKGKNGKFKKAIELNEAFESRTGKWLCVTEKEFWTDDHTLYFGLVTRYLEEGNEYEFYRVNINNSDDT